MIDGPVHVRMRSGGSFFMWALTTTHELNMVVLKNIPRILSPQLLSVLARMGHGDEIGQQARSY